MHMGKKFPTDLRGNAADIKLFSRNNLGCGEPGQKLDHFSLIFPGRVWESISRLCKALHNGSNILGKMHKRNLLRGNQVAPLNPRTAGGGKASACAKFADPLNY